VLLRDSMNFLSNSSLRECVQLIHSMLVVATGPATVAVAPALRFAFDLLDLPFIHSSTAANLAAKSFVSTGFGSSCNFTSNGVTVLLPLLSTLIHQIMSLSASGRYISPPPIGNCQAAFSP